MRQALYVKEMRHLRYAWAALAMLLGGMLAPLAARAQSPDRLKSLTISVWLEYDRPGALYIFRGQLPDGATLPATLVFRVPARSGGPSSTAGIDEAGEYHYIRPTLQEDGDSILVEYQINWPRFQFEYYDDVLQREGPNRQLDFSYRVEYAVDQLVLEVKEPYGATNFSLSPAATAQSQGEDGLTVHRRDMGAVAPGDEVRWQVQYNKNDARLASEALGLAPVGSSPYEAGPGITPPAAKSHNLVVFALLALLGLGTLVGLGLSLRSTNGHGGKAHAWAESAEPAGRRSRKRRAKGVPEPPQVRPARYCHQCGAALSRDDVYCRRCGTRRRGA